MNNKGLKDLYNKIKSIDTSQSEDTIVGVSIEKGMLLMKLQILEMVQDFYNKCQIAQQGEQNE